MIKDNLPTNQPTKQPQPYTPGIGSAGVVLCPFLGLTGGPCQKGGCELWVELTYNLPEGPQKVARCALAWIPVLSTEITSTIKEAAVNRSQNAPRKPGKGSK